MITFTGIAFAFPNLHSWYENVTPAAARLRPLDAVRRLGVLVGEAAGPRPDRRQRGRPDDPRGASIPNRTIDYIGVPHDKEGVYEAWMTRGFDPWTREGGAGNAYVFVDQYSGEIVYDGSPERRQRLRPGRGTTGASRCTPATSVGRSPASLWFAVGPLADRARRHRDHDEAGPPGQAGEACGTCGTGLGVSAPTPVDDADRRRPPGPLSLALMASGARCLLVYVVLPGLAPVRRRVRVPRAPGRARSLRARSSGCRCGPSRRAWADGALRGGRTRGDARAPQRGEPPGDARLSDAFSRRRSVVGGPTAPARPEPPARGRRPVHRGDRPARVEVADGGVGFGETRTGRSSRPGRRWWRTR